MDRPRPPGPSDSDLAQSPSGGPAAPGPAQPGLAPPGPGSPGRAATVPAPRDLDIDLGEVTAKTLAFAARSSLPSAPPVVGGVTGHAIDLSTPAVRADLLRWLNSWGCRLPYPRPDRGDLFDTSVAAWWDEWGGTLPDTRLAHLDDGEVDHVAASFGALCAVAVGSFERPRRIGPTAAAKALYALRPETAVPWDAAIATALHGGRDAAAYAAHLRLCRRWARSLAARAGVDDSVLAAVMGRPGTPLPKILDDYCYLTYTRGE